MLKHLLFVIVWMPLLLATSFADECQRNQGEVDDARPGRDTAHPIRFSYESRSERFNQIVKRYVWCIESDKDNQNIVQFKWGDRKHEDRYLDTLIEPGHGASSTKTDGSKRIHDMRFIKFTRKNRADWNTINTDTISSTKIGRLLSLAPLVQAQARGDDPAFTQFRNEDGLIQIDRLSSNRDLFVRFLEREKNVFAGGSLTVTLPLTQAVADLLHANNYQEYKSSDFVRARAILSSALSYVDGTVHLLYAVTVRPDANDAAPALQRLMKEGRLSFRILRLEDSPPSNVPFTAEPVPVHNFERVAVGDTKLDGQQVSLVPARLLIMAGSGAPFGSFAAPVFAIAQ